MIEQVQGMYREMILEEYKHPKNKGTLADATNTAHVNNPTCGDEITLTVKLEKDIIFDIKFEGVGCAISQASASLFTEHIKGKKVEDVLNMDENEILSLLGFEPNPMRMKCAVLIMRAVAKALGDTNA